MIKHIVGSNPPDITMKGNSQGFVELAITLKLFEILYTLSRDLDLLKR